MDHCKAKKRKTHPRETANIFSLLTFAYTGSIFKKANRKHLEEDDIYEVIKQCSSNKLGNQLQGQWNMEQYKKHPKSIYRIIWEMFYVRYLLLGVAILGFKILRSWIEPSAYANLVSYFNEEQTKLTRNDAYFYAGIVVAFNLTSTIVFHNLSLSVTTMGLEIRTCFAAFLYRKTLKLSPAALSKISFGNIITLITKDVMTFEGAIWLLNDLWIGLIHSCVVCYLLYSKIGATTFAGILIFFGVIPLQAYLGKVIKKLRMKTCRKTDERLETTYEALSMIKIIKMYTWELFFIEKINKARRLEINKMLFGYYLKLIVCILGDMVSKIGFCILIMAYIWMDNPPDSSIVFFIMSNYLDISWFFGSLLPDGIGRVAEFTSALVRLNTVLRAEEITVPLTKIHEKNYLKPMLEVNNVSIHMGQQEILKNISHKFKLGLTVITGPVGSGKSSLLKVLLQDFPLSKGEVKIGGTVSYASQDPWLFASSVKQNILFGQEYNQERYKEVLKVCALEYDLSLFDQGDETILSDKGLNLSKGQQARVNLARAIYNDSDIYLLDDCLTSLDNHVSDFIFERCIQQFLKGKFCILVSQIERHLKKADLVLLMRDGDINKTFTPSKRNDEEIYSIGKKLEDQVANNTKIKINDVSSETDKLLETEQNTERTQVFKEVLKEGSVPIRNYSKYIAFGGGCFMIFVYFIFSGFDQFAASYSVKLLTKWVDEQQKFLNIKGNISKLESNLSTSDISKNESTLYLNLTESLRIADVKQNETFTWYYAMILIAILLHIFKTYLIFDFCRRASIKIHTVLIKNLMHAVMLFYDTTYIGIILNRISQDMLNLDENLSGLLNDCFGILCHVLGAIILITSVNYYFIFYIAVITILMVVLGRLYLPFGRSMKRLEVATRSPIIGHLNSTFEGLTTIRACRAENILINEFDRHHDLFTSTHYTLLIGQWGYSFFASVLSAFLVTFVVGTFIFLETGSSAGSVGLALSQVFGIGQTIHWAVYQYTELESMMTSVERIFEYTDIKTENQSGSVGPNWPKAGAVTYNKVSLSYNKFDIILNELSFDILSKEKIGIVGRTGAGKSSIISTIFRLYDIEGKIEIDGTDIKTVPLQNLRRNLAIIPQDPVLFSKTFRSNLDPFNQHKDEDIWKAIEKVNLQNIITKLDMEVSNRASNFSLGQKQMICVARAILNKAKIVIIDEATANMDEQTELLISTTIKQNFSECTVLTIAHRLESILECDKIMVLDRGTVKEFSSPKQLLKNKDTYFYKMVHSHK